MSIRVLLTKDFEQMSDVAAEYVEQRLASLEKLQQELVLGLATGNSPTGMYRRLAAAANSGRLDSGRWRTFNLDEYVGLPGGKDQPAHPESYAHFMDENLFGLLEKSPRSKLLPPGYLIDAERLRGEMQLFPGDWRAVGDVSGKAVVIHENPTSTYFQWVRREVLAPFPIRVAASGGINLQVLGVGGGGHVAFHEAGIPFDLTGLLLVQLDDRTKRDSVTDGHFASMEECPQFALTMSIDLVFKAESILVLASGPRKESAIRRSLLESPSEGMPMSYVQIYSERGGEVTLVVDEAAAAGLLSEQPQLRKRGIQLTDYRSS